MADPALEVPPDFASDAYRLIQDTLTQATNETPQQAIDRLRAAWDVEHNERVLEEAKHARRELEDKDNCLAEEEVMRECREAEKKKPKMNDFNEAMPISNVIILCPLQYALYKLSTFDYVDLWYFSPVGCLEVSRFNRSNTDDAFGVTRIDDVLTLRSIASVKASHNSVEDHALPFEAFLQGFFVKNNFLLFYAKKASWPPKHLDSLAKFFWNIEMDPMQSGPNGSATILTYASQACQKWYDDLKVNRAFNIAIINKSLIHNISWEVNVKIGDERSCKAS
ncbi:hypothetical protein PAXRUDRAFT_137560 [Paxillus rubicundulus Ve08.2h10]|uniref:Uncharacterized protein n=1 Tax=Paxillus rubicundulus Ve08.2h10 TaxID=930991 RepID=A0A0D0EAU1_9AGAM|nr:hypothetical protein PAXRUDRAFT_137560 [Paxillus rubicundulus Ve08.2h10]